MRRIHRIRVMISIVAVLAIALTWVSILQLSAFDAVVEDSAETFRRCTPSCEMRAYETLDKPVETMEEAVIQFGKYVRSDYGFLTRLLNNDIHVVFDETTNRFDLRYDGFLFATTIYGYIEKGSDRMYHIRELF